MRLQNHVAIVTGAAHNIGRAIARSFAAEGAKVLIADIQDEAGEAVAESIRSNGGEASFFHADVGTDAGNRGMVATAVERYGGVTILVNNAHWERRGSIEELSEEDWDASLAVLLKAPFLASKYAVPHMRAAGGGAILNLSSVHGFQVSPGYPTYETAKAALIQLTKQMALDLGNDSIRVNALAPGAIPSDEMREENAHDPIWHERNILWNVLPHRWPRGGHRPGGALPLFSGGAFRYRAYLAHRWRLFARLQGPGRHARAGVPATTPGALGVRSLPSAWSGGAHS